ncbi:MAG: hypothetical protein ACERJ1_05550 [Halodesulfovibrio sp.]|uniref:hypothetical protein n=1 Tax=Halodesulfovibrio sp. TaxID=1912772 RepID=UPI00359D4B1E
MPRSFPAPILLRSSLSTDSTIMTRYILHILSAILFCLLVISSSCFAADVQNEELSIGGDPFADDEGFTIPQELIADSTTSVDGGVFTYAGFFESRNQFGLNTPKTPISIRQRLRIEADYRYNQFSGFLSVDGDYEFAAQFWDGTGHKALYPCLRSAYLSYDSDNLDVIVGSKVIRWGTGDGINPMDLINPLDVRDPIASGRADNRLPVWLANATLVIGDWALEGVFLPVASVEDIPRQGNPWVTQGLSELYEGEDAGTLELDSQEVPNKWFSDVEFGARLSRNIEGWDVALIGYYGFVNSPVYGRYETASGVPEFRPKHPRFAAFGLNFAKGVGDGTIRGELAYKPQYPVAMESSSDGIGRRDLWQWVVGGDYNYDGIYYVNLQFFMDAVSQYFSTADEGFVGTKLWHGITYELSRTFLRDDLKLGVRGKAYTSNDGAIVEAFGEYKLGDEWSLSTGVMIWTGSNKGLLGQYDNNDLYYFTARYYF